MEKINESEDVMDNSTPIQYLLIGDITNNKIITEFSSTINSAQIKKEITQIFTKICKTKRYNERNKISSKESIYYFTLVKPNFLFIILVEEEYSEELVFELIDKINEEKITSMINEETQELNPNGRVELKNIIEIYQKKGEEDNDTDKVNKDNKKDNNENKVFKEKLPDKNFDKKSDIDSQVKTTLEIEDLQTKNDVFLLADKKNKWDIRNLEIWRNYKFWIYMAIIVLIILIIVIII